MLLDLCRFLSWFRPDHFFTGGSVIMDYGLVFLWWICFFWLLKTLTDGLEWCGLLWCFYQLFGLSFWRHPFTAEDPLVSKCYISLNLMKKQTHLHLWLLEGEYIFSTFKFLGELFFHTVHCSQTECIILPSFCSVVLSVKLFFVSLLFFIWLSLSTSGLL